MFPEPLALTLAPRAHRPEDITQTCRRANGHEGDHEQGPCMEHPVQPPAYHDRDDERSHHLDTEAEGESQGIAVEDSATFWLAPAILPRTCTCLRLRQTFLERSLFPPVLPITHAPPPGL